MIKHQSTKNLHSRFTVLFQRLKGRVYSLINTFSFINSKDYWEKRYAHGGNSGSGSYGKLAQFKAEIINLLMHKYGIRSIIEFGCGDGNQLSLLDNTVDYIGLDVSATAIAICRQKYHGDTHKRFAIYDARRPLDVSLGFRAEMSMSVDVIIHLVEDSVFSQYLHNLFSAAERFVLIYSTNQDSSPIGTLPHVRHRRFSDRLATEFPTWTLVEHILNRFPLVQNKDGSDAEFFLYKRKIQNQ